MRKTATIVALTLAGALAVSAAPASATATTEVSCGQTLTHSVRLANDLKDCPGDGLVIGASGVTVDLNGHTIDGVATQIDDCDVRPSGPAGIQNSGGYDGLTIKNGTLQQFSSGFNAGSDTEAMADSRLVHLVARDNRFSGLTMGSGAGDVTNDNRIVGNTVTGNGCAAGIVVNSGHGNLVSGNRATNNQTGILICCSHDNAVTGNVAAGNGEDGIAVCCGPGAYDNLVAGNEVRDNANIGIIVFFGANHNTVRSNRVSGNADNIVIVEGPGNRVIGNAVSNARGCSFCDPPTGFGIAVGGDADATSIVGNIVSHTVWDGIRVGFGDLDEGTVIQGSLVRDNAVRDAAMDGIRVDTNTTGTVLRGNIAKGAGDDGLDVDSAATRLEGNLALLNRDLGIEAVPGVTDGGGNRARHNGNPAQCTGIACG
jgi:parallel beta-helix repeat protein